MSGEKSLLIRIALKIVLLAENRPLIVRPALKVILLAESFRKLETRHRDRLYRWALITIQWGLAFIFIGFGAVKAYCIYKGWPGPPVVMATGAAIGKWIPGFPSPEMFTVLVGLWEIELGLCFVSRRIARLGIFQMVVHQPATFIPFLVAPGVAFIDPPMVPDFAGLYILKNFLLVGGAMILWWDLIPPESTPLMTE